MGYVFTHDMWYWPAEQNRTLHIYLPDGYDQSNERYPVMYMWDGHNLFFDECATYGKSWGLKSFLDNWEKPMIVVGMECSHEGDRRLFEYSPYDRHMFGHEIVGMGEQTFQWLINDVKAWTDEHLRTWPHREATGIGGSSMGGTMSLYGVIAHNDVFSKAACVSTGVRFIEREVRRDLARAELSPDTRIYLSWGEHEGGRTRKGADPATESPEAKAELDLVRRLVSRGVSTYLYFQPNGEHNEACWEAQNGRYLDYLWLDRPWQ